MGGLTTARLRRGRRAIPAAAALLLAACSAGATAPPRHSSAAPPHSSAAPPHSAAAPSFSSARPPGSSSAGSSSAPALPQVAVNGNGGLAVGAGGVWVLEDAGTHTAVAHIDPSTLRVVDTIATGRGAVSLTVGAGAVWVPNRDDGTVTRIDPADNTAQTVRVGRSPWEVGVHGQSVWLVYENGTLARLNPRTGRPIGAPYDFGRFAQFRFEAQDCDIVAGGQALWVYATGGVSLRIPLHNGTPGPATKFRPASAIVADGKTLWVAQVDPFTLARVDADTGKVRSVRPDHVQSLVAAPSGIWQTSLNTVTRRNARTGAVLSTQTLGSPDSQIVLAAGDGGVWGFHLSDHTLTRLSP